ncbi:MAG: T9SS type A sorting domain-containing protein [Proteobacteria bacterium]|nr:T9SS type A sorting domain-containing protein [Pseudomonadota bacterium]
MVRRQSSRVLISAVVLIAATSIASSQISITQADVESLAGKFQLSYSAINAAGFDLSLSGGNRTWNLSAYTYNSDPDLRLTHLVFPPAGAPDVGNPAFSQANYAIKSESQGSLTWQYAKVSSGGVEVLGNIDTATVALAPGLKILGAFPARYGSTWSSISAASSPALPPAITVSIAASGSLDSWGTMILPAGGGATVSKSVLRLKLLQTTTIRLGSFIIAQFSSTSYQWLGSPIDGQFYVASASPDSIGGLKTLSYYTPFNVDPVSVLVRDQVVPQSPALLPNYPNPFNPSTTIPFLVADEGPVSVAVYNSLGEVVTRLVKTTLAPGTYSVTFDARGLPSGLYAVRLESRGIVLTRKVMLLK